MGPASTRRAARRWRKRGAPLPRERAADPGPQPPPEAIAARGWRGDGRAHEADPVVEWQLARDEPREPVGHRRLDPRAVQRPREERDEVEGLDRLADLTGHL